MRVRIVECVGVWEVCDRGVTAMARRGVAGGGSSSGAGPSWTPSTFVYLAHLATPRSPPLLVVSVVHLLTYEDGRGSPAYWVLRVLLDIRVS